MEAHAKTIRQILESGNQYLIPFFQRSYSWRKPHWTRLWSDVAALSRDEHTGQHFMGPLVCTLEKASPGELPLYLLIDGQQRITTLTLLLAAMRDISESRGDKKLAAKIHESYLVHRHEEDLKRYKVLPRIGDREVLINIIDGQLKLEHNRSPVATAYRFFHRSLLEGLEAVAEPLEITKVLAVVADRLSLVVITIDGENPFEIFESLNSTGLPLEESDLIRNFLFMQVHLSKQEKFNQTSWKPFEAVLEAGRNDSSKAATMFYRHYLMRNGAYSAAKSTFMDFKLANQSHGPTPEEQVRELTHFAQIDRILREPSACEVADLKAALDQISRLDVTTAYPLLMNLLDRHKTGSLSPESLLGCLADLASFVIRRSICGDSTRSYGRWFVEAIAVIGQDPRQDLRVYWFKRGWPDDKSFFAQLKTFPIYRREQKKLRLILETLEVSLGHKEKVKLSDLQIEHVMPQHIGNTNDGRSWQSALGESWKEVHQSLLHTLGNLTLTGYNPKLSNRSYASKRVEFAKSHVELNRFFEKVEDWNGAVIEKRTIELGKKLAKLWPRPDGPEYVRDPEFSEDQEMFCEEYWTEFCRRLETQHPEFKIRGHKKSSYLWIKGPRQSFWYVLQVEPERQYMGVGIATTGKNALEYLSLLWAWTTWEEIIAIEDLLDAPVDCDPSICEFYVERDEVPVKDRARWATQHAWLIECLRVLRDALSEKILELSLANYDADMVKQLEIWANTSDADEPLGKRENLPGPDDLDEGVAPAPIA